MRRKVRSLSDIYHRTPKCVSSTVSADPQFTSIHISAAYTCIINI
ncbi:hypothetical protein MTR67_028893 [Solanum verrucosum]|uniref:Uncharacterized protein n=1 Tax=Solanum verrucosum TaxID=315347 RepID=A0AAF0R7G8_SOLVR|nr:hypothetical protein MTR67_028893 [Solanum verrucosum]